MEGNEEEERGERGKSRRDKGIKIGEGIGGDDRQGGKG